MAAKLLCMLKVYTPCYYNVGLREAKKIFTCSIHLLFVNNIFCCVREKDSIIFSAKIHSDKVGGRSGDGQDDVLLGGEVKGDSSHSQLAGEKQKLPHSCKKDDRRICEPNSYLCQRE